MAHHENIGIGVIGLGFIGRAHVQATLAAHAAGFPCRLAAICDEDAARVQSFSIAGENAAPGTPSTQVELPSTLHRHTSVHDLLADSSVQLVCICTYTETHGPLAIRALAAGKHVLVEKPVALSTAALQPLLDSARSAGTLCMPAMCMRFWPGWDWLHDRIADQSFGSLRRARFQRLGTMPGWSSFYADHARSGGVMLDLHVHDVDFIHWCLGTPSSVHSTGSPLHVTTRYAFDHLNADVTAEGSWDQPAGHPFVMRFVVEFRDATADFDLSRDPHLTIQSGARKEVVALPALTGYDGQLRHLVTAIAEYRQDLRATLVEAASVLNVIEVERKSLATGTAVAIPSPDPR